MSIENNPFNPGYGALPPVLAGRDDLKNEVSRRLAKAGKGEIHPTAIALIGPRGCGKTALLGWIAGKAEKKKLPVIRLNKEDFTTVGDLESALSDQVVSPNKSHDFSLEVKDPTGQLGTAGLELTRKSEYTPIENNLFLTDLLTSVSTKGLAILVDEAHDMPPEVGRVFYDAARQPAIPSCWSLQEPLILNRYWVVPVPPLSKE